MHHCLGFLAVLPPTAFDMRSAADRAVVRHLAGGIVRRRPFEHFPLGRYHRVVAWDRVVIHVEIIVVRRELQREDVLHDLFVRYGLARATALTMYERTVVLLRERCLQTIAMRIARDLRDCPPKPRLARAHDLGEVLARRLFVHRGVVLFDVTRDLPHTR